MNTSRTAFQTQWASAIAKTYRTLMRTELREADARRRTGRAHPATAASREAVRDAIGALRYVAGKEQESHRYRTGR